MTLFRRFLRWLEGPPPAGRTLQERYPPGPGAFVTHYSSVELDDEAFVARPRTYAEQLTDARQEFRGDIEGTLRELREQAATFEARIEQVGSARAFRAWCRHCCARLMDRVLDEKNRTMEHGKGDG